MSDFVPALPAPCVRGDCWFRAYNVPHMHLDYAIGPPPEYTAVDSPDVPGQCNARKNARCCLAPGHPPPHGRIRMFGNPAEPAMEIAEQWI